MSTMNSGQIAPGLQTLRTASHRLVMLAREKYEPGVFIISGSKSRDPLSAVVSELRAGLLMGRITSGLKLAPSIMGVVKIAYDGSTTLNVAAAVAVELVRRVGATGTFKVTGPPTAAGVVRTLTLTYSAVNTTTGDITVTAANVNEVQTITPTGDGSAGSWTLQVPRVNGTIGTTGPLAFSASIATIQTALDLATGVVNGIVASGSGAPVDVPNALVLTYSGTGYAANTWPLAVFIPGTSITGNTVNTTVRTTTGVDGRMVVGSFVQPTDGSETPVTILENGFPMRVTDIDGNNIDLQLGHYLTGGLVQSSQIINWPSDTSLRAQIVSWLRASSGLWEFDHLHSQ